MEIQQLSKTIQEFCGVRYYLCGRYFQRNGERLHRAVWEAVNGRRIPDGYAVHHIDGDRANNRPDNLMLLERGAHTSHHQAGHDRGVPEQAVDAAKRWHQSEKGRSWHKRHYESNSGKLHKTGKFVCEHCGKLYAAQITGANRFCSNKCKTRARFLSGVDDEERACLVCGARFVANRYVKKSCCSRKCAAAMCVRKRSGE